jgi:hypothetical protein
VHYEIEFYSILPATSDFMFDSMFLLIISTIIANSSGAGKKSLSQTELEI